MPDADDERTKDVDGLQALAKDYLDLWQDHAALTASDPRIAEQWQSMFEALAGKQPSAETKS